MNNAVPLSAVIWYQTGKEDETESAQPGLRCTRCQRYERKQILASDCVKFEHRQNKRSAFHTPYLSLIDGPMMTKDTFRNVVDRACVVL